MRLFSRLSASVGATLLGVVLWMPVDAPAQSAGPEDFSALVRLSALRLDLSRQVALVKWDTGQPVADPPGDPREQQVIAAVATEAEERGLSRAGVSAFFEDQIEASKLVQFVLIAGWRRVGQAPDGPRRDLRAELRPALDRLRGLMIEELATTDHLRGTADCSKRLVDAIARHVQANGSPPLDAIGLDRGLARVCSR